MFALETSAGFPSVAGYSGSLELGSVDIVSTNGKWSANFAETQTMHGGGMGTGLGDTHSSIFANGSADMVGVGAAIGNFTLEMSTNLKAVGQYISNSIDIAATIVGSLVNEKISPYKTVKAEEQNLNR